MSEAPLGPTRTPTMSTTGAPALASRRPVCRCAPDCAERIACEETGVGHAFCGWCETCGVARHNGCRCMSAEAEKARLAQALRGAGVTPSSDTVEAMWSEMDRLVADRLETAWDQALQHAQEILGAPGVGADAAAWEQVRATNPYRRQPFEGRRRVLGA